MDQDRMKAFSRRVFENIAGGLTGGLAYIGVKTGLFEAMAGQGPMSVAQLSEATGLQARYMAEWVNAMVAAGYLDYDAAGQSYTLPDEHAYFLASEGSDHYMGGLFYAMPAMMRVAPHLEGAFRHGGGVPFEHYGDEWIRGMELAHRGIYENRFASSWLEQVPDAVQALSAAGRALDFGCGTGWVPLAVARAFPEAHCVGVDADGGSIEHARRNAEEAGLADRVRFRAGSVEALSGEAPFDLISLCDCLHDLADPVGNLRGLREHLRPGGTLFVMEPKVSDRLEENVHPIASMYYGMSVFHCMTQSLARDGAGLGACLGPTRVRGLLEEAGFRDSRVLDIRSAIELFIAATR